jgi:hypothetical protein
MVVGKQRYQRQFHAIVRRGFALPTVLISSIVLIIVLTAAVSATSAVRENLLTQYYDQLAQVAGEAGVAYAKACLAANGNVPLWNNAKPLTPATDCSGNALVVSSTPTVQVLVVAGGGSGGTSGPGNGGAGGGGAGGLIYNAAYSVTGGQAIPITVGNGGAAVVGTSLAGSNGQNSVFGTLTAIGGGAGGRASPGNSGSVGGSGGGGGFFGYTTTVNGSAGTAGQGNSGGASVSNNNGGGGGGAGGAGGNTNPLYNGTSGGTGGAGGVGSAYTISGSSLTYARGGEGATWPSGSLQNGAANTGNGGSASAYSAATTSGAGGSGIVVVSYPTGLLTATGGTMTTSGGNTIHTFTASGTFTITAINPISCPSDSHCFVTNNGDVRSSFSVGLPTLDANGQAVTIPNSGYVQLIRTSTGAVWKTYTQPTAQAAVVPDLCSGTATSDLGWNNAVSTGAGAAFTVDPNAVPISISSAAINAGPTYYRKDFSVTQAGTYTISSLVSGNGYFYVDGWLTLINTIGSTQSTTVSLNTGCHTITAELDNTSISPASTWFKLALKSSSSNASSPLVHSDTSWRVSAGNLVSFSDPNYYQASAWAAAVQLYSTSGNATWAAQGTWPDVTAGWVGSSNGTAGSYPFSKYTYFIDNHKDVWNLNSAAQVKIYTQCDDSCTVYLDGDPVLYASVSTNVQTVTLSLSAGQHRIGVELYNAGAVNNPSGFMLTAIDTTTNRAIDNTSSGQWLSSNSWVASSTIPYSYANNFVSTPDTINSRHSLNVLAIGGGGGGGANGGGGGGAGGVVINNSFQANIGAYPVTIGGGGAHSNTNTITGSSGANTIFGNATLGIITAYGGGGGASRDGGVQGISGGSSGGGSGASAAPRQLSSVALQGNIGANGSTPDPGCAAAGGGGGGAGSVGTNGASGTAGNGGYGLTTIIGGTTLQYAGGGAGAITCVANGVNGTAVAGYGGGAAAASTTANSGGGGGGGSGSQVATDGAAGKVVIWYPVGKITATGGTITTSSDTLYTIHTFTSSGTFTITALN